MPTRDTRERLREAAIRCIAERGSAATTARDVAGAAQANLASIGYHFGSMETLLDEALIVATERWIGPLIERVTAGDGIPLRERVVSGLSALVDSLPEHRHTVIAFFEALARVERSDPLRVRLAAGYDELRAALVSMVADGSAYRDTAIDGASAVIALYDGVMVQWLLDPSRTFDIASMVDSLGAVLVPGSTPRAEATVR